MKPTVKQTYQIFVLTILAVVFGSSNALAYRDLDTGTFMTKDPAGFVDGPNLYTYVKQNPWTKFDPEGLSGELTIETQADGTRLWHGMGPVTGNHSWLVYKNDNPKFSTTSYGTFGNDSGAQGKPGLNFNTELADPKYKATQTRSMHIDDQQEKQFRQFLADQLKKGAAAWSNPDPCSSFAASGWNTATGEKIDPKNGTTGVTGYNSSTPQLLGEAIKKANGGKDNATVTPSAKQTSYESQAAMEQAVASTGNGATNTNAPQTGGTPFPQKQVPANAAPTKQTAIPVPTPPPAQK